MDYEEWGRGNEDRKEGEKRREWKRRRRRKKKRKEFVSNPKIRR